MENNNPCCNTQPKFTFEKIKTYWPLVLVILYIVLGSGISYYFAGNMKTSMRVFMGLFFLVFSFFKLLDLSAFAKSYASYDIPTKMLPAWGFIYPFVELFLGVMYLTNTTPIFTNIIAIVVMSVSLVGVVQAVISKTKIQCACLGTGFDLPMSTITIIEDATMIFMAIFMLLTI